MTVRTYAIARLHTTSQQPGVPTPGPGLYLPQGATGCAALGTVTRGNREWALVWGPEDTYRITDIQSPDWYLMTSETVHEVPRSGSHGQWNARFGVQVQPHQTLAAMIAQSQTADARADGSTVLPAMISSGTPSDPGTRGYVLGACDGLETFREWVDPDDPRYDQVLERYRGQVRAAAARHGAASDAVGRILGRLRRDLAAGALSEGAILDLFARGVPGARVVPPRTEYGDSFNASSDTALENWVATEDLNQREFGFGYRVDDTGVYIVEGPGLFRVSVPLQSQTTRAVPDVQLDSGNHRLAVALDHVGLGAGSAIGYHTRWNDGAGTDGALRAWLYMFTTAPAQNFFYGFDGAAQLFFDSYSALGMFGSVEPLEVDISVDGSLAEMHFFVDRDLRFSWGPSTVTADDAHNEVAFDSLRLPAGGNCFPAMGERGGFWFMDFGGAPPPLEGALALDGAGTLALGGAVEVPGELAVAGAGALGLDGVVEVPGELAVVGEGAIALDGAVVTPATGELGLDGAGALVLTGRRHARAELAVIGEATLRINGGVGNLLEGELAVVGEGAIALDGVRHPVGSVGLVGAGALQLDGIVGAGDEGQLALAGAGIFEARGTRRARAQLEVAGAGALQLDGVLAGRPEGRLALAGMAVLGLEGGRHARGRLALAGAAALALNGGIPGTATLDPVTDPGLRSHTQQLRIVRR